VNVKDNSQAKYYRFEFLSNLPFDNRILGIELFKNTTRHISFV